MKLAALMQSMLGEVKYPTQLVLKLYVTCDGCHGKGIKHYLKAHLH